MVVGTPGGPRIITMVYHVISNVIDHRMSLAEAVAAPRMHHQALPDTLQVETRRVHPRDAGQPAGSGPRDRDVPGYWGDVEAIIRTPERGGRA